MVLPPPPPSLQTIDLNYMRPHQHQHQHQLATTTTTQYGKIRVSSTILSSLPPPSLLALHSTTPSLTRVLVQTQPSSSLSGNNPLLLPPSLLMRPRNLLLFLLILLLLLILILAMRARRHPQSALAVLHRAVLTRQINALALFAVAVAALREVAGAGAEFGLHGRVGRDPVGEGVFAVLDDAKVMVLVCVRVWFEGG